MTYAIPVELHHEHAWEIARLLTAVFRDDVGAANKWLRDRSDYFCCSPLELLKLDGGAGKVISYLKEAAP